MRRSWDLGGEVNDVADLSSTGVLLGPMVVRRIHLGG
jgi:hypothetical protein